MDGRSAKLYQAIEDYLEFNGNQLPDSIKNQLTETREMLSAPRYSPESPGERAAREVSEANAPQDLNDALYGGASTENSDTGVFKDISQTTLS